MGASGYMCTQYDAVRPPSHTFAAFWTHIQHMASHQMPAAAPLPIPVGSTDGGIDTAPPHVESACDGRGTVATPVESTGGGRGTAATTC